MWYIYPQIILSLAIGIYLCCCYKRQSVRNRTTLGLITGFFSLALAGITHFVISSDSDLLNDKILYFARNFFLLSGLIHILWAIIILVTDSIIFRYVLPIFIYVLGIFLAYWGIFIADNIPLVTLIVSYGFFVPLDLALGIFFLLLYTRLSFIKEGFKNNLGPFLISLGWFIHAINMGRLYFVLDKPGMDPYLLLIAIPYVLWLIGFILLEKETQKAFETKMKIHGFRRKDAKDHQNTKGS